MLRDVHVEGESLTDTTANNATPGGKTKLDLEVAAIKIEAEGVKSFELRAADGSELPAFTAGAHIETHLPSDMIRSYSLCSDPADRTRYVFAVLREAEGRGGSRYLHDEVHEGDTLTITTPRNHFPLAGREARHHLLLAGGIGVTPMISMIAELEARKAPWSMHYCTRSPDRTAFLDILKPHIEAGKVTLHHRGGDPARGLDIKKRLETFEIGTHLYYCGPQGFMQTVSEALEPWPPFCVHREFFQGTGQGLSMEGNEAFQIKLKSSGQTLDVPADKTIVDVLRDNNVRVETDCNEGYCGTCITKFLAGQPDHRDTVLSEKERKTYIMVCCSRAKGLMTLDL